MALPECVGKMKSLLGTGAVLSLCFIAFTGCGAESDGRSEAIGANTTGQESIATRPDSGRNGSPQAEVELPLIDSEAVISSLPWIVDTLKLDSRYSSDDFQISNYEISADRRYAIINISNGARSGTSGPFYRFLVFNPRAERIFFPPEAELRSQNLGYSYIAARFDDSNRVAIAYGHRSIEASIVALPEGKVLQSHELELFDTAEIEKALANLLEQSQ